MRYLLLGAGLQGTAIAWDLLRQVDDTASLAVVDRDPGALARLRARFGDDPRLSLHEDDVEDLTRLGPRLDAADVVISAVNYWFNDDLTALAIAHRAHFLDLGGNNAIVARQLARDSQARQAGVTVVPDTGLAPGLAGILGWHLAAGLDPCDAVRLRVGGLPLEPRPPLNYQLVFSVQGLINEYIEGCLVIRDGEIRTVPGLSELETLIFPEPFGELEAFQTSGGTSTLPQSLLGRVRSLDYKTIRYRGHCEQIRLLRDLGLTSSEPVEVDGAWVAPRSLLAGRLEAVVPRDGDDVVLLLAEAEGFAAETAGRPPSPLRRSIRIIDRNDRSTGLSAMMRMTGFPAAIIARMLARGEIEAPGAVPQETIVPAERLLAELARRGVRVECWDSDPTRPNPGPTKE
ncbi:MAG TPA: saccharopine dehydrogenase C-terminal domain-containing protein [Candidatus Krumholzibacteria bacterium]|nr:saccharopine dehydrogenase C-terminal domain-containing protein [Candidatus Krumholzibacteria bacterium]HPD72599.1 saccharopine dehydrogenase C-terminal domain-containing protein [Candidatus Krumholzibacteria bacterium]HRY40469.1 saccharopine dehydrogenase C-terminal domain-containing protein [Candidatus Krumholzibacteria bacterium]